jgi:hypothetical protein
MGKFKIVYRLKGKDGDVIRIEPNSNILSVFEKFVNELFPKFSFEKAGFPNSQKYDDLVDKKFLDDSGKCLFQISFYKEYIQFDNWDDVEKMDRILPKYCENPEEVSEIISTMKDKILEQVDVNLFLDKLVDFLNKQNINSVEVYYHSLSSLSEDEDNLKKCVISKIKNFCEEVLSEHRDISISIEELKLFIHIEDNGDKIYLRFKEDLDVSALF